MAETMPIRMTTTEAEIASCIERQIERQIAVIERTLNYIGEQCVNAARDSDGYKDRTGNLRSSTGYILVRDGRVVRQSKFDPVSGGSEGGKSGEEYARKLAMDYPDGFALIVVAGMNYAAYVSAKGRDVLDSAELLAERLVPQMLKQLGLK